MVDKGFKIRLNVIYKNLETYIKDMKILHRDSDLIVDFFFYDPLSTIRFSSQ